MVQTMLRRLWESITLSLVSSGYLNSVDVPFWVILICALAMGLGTAFGGWKVIKTMGVTC